MSAPNIPLKKIGEVRDELNSQSPSFCLAKWLQVTIHLQNGQTHSCHHPKTHKIPIHELKMNPAALHNTSQKMLARKDLLEGVKTAECSYCWNIEEAHPDNFSDRSIKSSQPWSYPRMVEVKNLQWNNNIVPSYVEVSFGSECNLKCAYCAPHISSSIMQELKKFGPYSTSGAFTVEGLKEDRLYPYPKDENPYVDAFWKWWNVLSQTIKVFRITGGEPLLNSNTFKFLERLKKEPLEDLTLAINSNLSVPPATFRVFIDHIKELTSKKALKEFQLFTSVDTHGKNAEFIRWGLDYQSFMKNSEQFLKEVPECELIFMCAYNAFSVLNFRKFLEDIIRLKKLYKDSNGKTRVTLDIPYLKDPAYLSCYVLTDEFIPIIDSDVQFMKENSTHDNCEIFLESEIFKLERIVTWMNSLEENEHRNGTRRELATFIREYEIRKEIKASDYLPEYKDFISMCSNS